MGMVLIMYTWINNTITGVIDIFNTNNVYDLLDYLDINLIKLDPNNILLRGNESVYCRNYLDQEIIFIRDDLNIDFEKFIIAHELGHALLHTNIYEAAFNKNFINVGKLEKQANYFAFNLLDIHFDEVACEGMTLEQISNIIGIPHKTLYQIVNLK